MPEDCRPVVEALEKAKDLVTHFIQTGLMVKLDNTLKQECETRWNTGYIVSTVNGIFPQLPGIRDVNGYDWVRFWFASVRSEGMNGSSTPVSRHKPFMQLRFLPKNRTDQFKPV